MNPEKKRVNINTYKYIRSSYELEIVSGSVCRIFVLNIKNMNRLTLSILVTVMIDHPIHLPVVGQRDSRHAAVMRVLAQVVQTRHAIEQGVFTMYVQMNKGCQRS